MSPLQSWPTLPPMMTSGGKPPQMTLQQHNPLSQESVAGEAPLNLTKPKGHTPTGNRNSSFTKHENGSPIQQAQSNPRDSPRNSVPPGLVLPPTFMPFTTFPLQSGEIR